MELGRLLALVRLSGAQALEIGAGVLETAAGEKLPAGEGPDRSAAVPIVDAGGRVVLGSTGHHGRVGPPPPAGTPRPAVDALLAEIAAAARPAGPSAGLHLAELDRAVRDLPTFGVPVIARRLEEAAASIDRAGVRAEIAALVSAVQGGLAPGGMTPPAGAPSAAAPREPAPARGAVPGRARSARRRIGAWLLSLLVLAGVVLLEIAVLRGRITTDIGMLLDAGRGGSERSAPPRPDGVRIVPPAPASAGGVSGVDLRPLAGCTTAAPCTVRLQVLLRPRADAQVVTWSYVVVDHCTGTATTAPGGTVTVPPGATRAAVVGTVQLPPVRGAAIVAVTQLPAAAASSPVLVGSCASGVSAK